MKKYIILILMALIFLSGCGGDNSPVLVSYKTVTPAELQAMCPDCLGYADWNFNDDSKQYNECTIYTMPMTDYDKEYLFYWALGREARHCRDGYYDENTDQGIPQ